MAHVYLSLVNPPLSWATKPRVVLSSYSTETHLPDLVVVCILPLLVTPLTHHGFFVMAPYTQDINL